MFRASVWTGTFRHQQAERRIVSQFELRLPTPCGHFTQPSLIAMSDGGKLRHKLRDLIGNGVVVT